jgi:hypothetical protein
MHKFILVSGIAIALATTAAPVLAKGQYTCKPKITGVGYSDASPPAAANLEARKRARKDYRDKAVAAYGSQIYSMNAKEWCRMMQGGAHKCYHKATPCVKNAFKPSSSQIKPPRMIPNTRAIPGKDRPRGNRAGAGFPRLKLRGGQSDRPVHRFTPR